MLRIVLAVFSLITVVAIVVLLQPTTLAQQTPNTELTASHAAAQLGICAETLVLCGATSTQTAGIRDKLMAASPLRSTIASRQRALDSANQALALFMDTTPAVTLRTQDAKTQRLALEAVIASTRASLKSSEAILLATVLSDLSTTEQQAFARAVGGLSSGIPAPYRNLDLTDGERTKLPRMLRHEETDRLNAQRYEPETLAAMGSMLSDADRTWLGNLRAHADYLATEQSLEQNLGTLETTLGF